MLLTQIRDHIQAQGRVSLQALAERCRHDPALVRDLVAVWCRKGKVRPLPQGARCQGCTLCAAEALEFYEWIGPPAAAEPDPRRPG